MAERVPIAHFADPYTAELAASFLEIRGFDAIALEKSGYRASGGGIVLVPRAEAVSAVGMLNRVRNGELADPGTDIQQAEASIVTRLARALGEPPVPTSWAHHLPVILVGAVVILSIVGLLIASALFAP